MPGMNGFETAHLIRKRRRSAHTPIIFLTAFADEVQTSQGIRDRRRRLHLDAGGSRDPARQGSRLRRIVPHARSRWPHQAEEQAKRAAAEESARRFDVSGRGQPGADQFARFRSDGPRPVAAGRARAGRSRRGNADADAGTITGPASWSGSIRRPAKFQPCGDFGRRRSADALRDCHDRVLATGKAETLDNLDIAYPAGLGERPPTSASARRSFLPLRCARPNSRRLDAGRWSSSQRRFGSGRPRPRRRFGRARRHRARQCPAVPRHPGERPPQERIPGHAVARTAQSAGSGPQCGPRHPPVRHRPSARSIGHATSSTGR